MRPLALAAFPLLVSTAPALAQHDEHAHHEPAPHARHAAGPLGLPAAREASGTAWQPDTTPHFGVQRAFGSWSVMLHWNAFAGWNDQRGGDRGDAMVTTPNWVMGMAGREAGGGRFLARTMLSLEPATLGGEGYPLLLQTGESWEGEPLHDRQHPHDLFMEVAASYIRELTPDVAAELYLAPAGEPALGPVAFPHRLSSWNDPLATLGHHWQDATHITYGVATVGLFTRRAKLEGSWFNGREPDEDRWGFDLAAPESYSGRLTLNPHESLSMQVSAGFLKEPEGLKPDVDAARFTASAMWNRGPIASTVVFGRNDEQGEEPTDSFLAEARLAPGDGNLFFGRIEHVGKDGHDLVLPEEELHEIVFPITAFSLGYARELPKLGPIVPVLGVRGSMTFLPDELEPHYGTTSPMSFMVHLQIQPPLMKH